MYIPVQKALARILQRRPSLFSIGVIFIGIVIVSLLVNHQQKSIATDSIAMTPTKSEQLRQLDVLNSIDTSSLSPLQSNVLFHLKQEFAKYPTSYDKTVLKYTEGFKESWCADFVSWIMKESGSPNINTETGYWRIPGVLSMMNYYRDINGYVTTDEQYSPRLGDVAFYIGEETPDGSSGEHIAFVLSYDGETLTTLGGNEGDGVMRIRSEAVSTHTKKGLIGYGILE